MYAFLFNGIDFYFDYFEEKNLTTSQRNKNHQLTYLNSFEWNFWKIFLVDIELRINGNKEWRLIIDVCFFSFLSLW